MLTKQMRELERQAQVVNQNKEYMIQLSDLMFDEYNGTYYVGNIVDMDGSDWVNRDMAQQILNQLNVDWMS
jgi:hypothetical protein